ncbi:glutathione ABC transporter substrate-binding protein [Isachenkonia alkalipeptolytica]|uniref:Glutathione ABC transporter substrate-binding protein n=1 Tax=Isachenkonia alkalipeptolytica TaxID=2565777 RepID=A0AA43XJH2_9CLOT|nr:glutathione ABC transporter substrate-binding protein [Isachenkonia alkalipeptolytica]NBG87998.1 glutathione ABC transporter substrate-binding protein [Isachenkonia alkalipeptolytica]
MNSKKIALLLALLLMVAAFAIGCGDEAATDTLVVAQGADADSLDPHATNDQPSSRVMKQVYESLLNQNEDMELVPGLAEEWEQIDELTFEFKLREGVMFHNGEELTASDVEFTLLRALESPDVGHIVGAIDPDGFEIIDDYTIRISTVEPFAPLLAHLAHTASSILNQTAVEEHGDDYGENPVGTGPYMLEDWTRGATIELTRFEDFHGENGKMENITFRNIQEDGNRTIELETGEIDIAYDILPTDISRIEENQELELARDLNFSTVYLGFNTEKEPFDDVRVRQAINYAVNVESIIDSVMEGSGEVATGPIGPMVWGANEELEPYGHDIEKAKELMEEAGYEDGFSTTIWTNDNQLRQDIAQITQSQLEEIGIDVEIEVLEWGAYLDGTAAGDHDMFILGWVTVTGDPDYGLYALFHSEQFGSAGNRTFWGDERVDELLDEARRSAEPDVREDAYMEVQEIVRDEAPWLFLNTGEDRTGLRSNVSGFRNHPAGHHPLWDVTIEN